MTPLTEDELAELQRQLPEWKVVEGRLSTTRKLGTFTDALDFVQKVGLLAEELNHHPDIDIRWRNVTITTCTHDAHNQVTRFDRRLAERISAL
ncbi:MAG TPA: 4a-hydroxytetrahydrobiopterin dehydratase [Mycobacteriales bacterium]|nr:4a-hydroxytetrahydrobiopterin dehydratase [Mycobacteriales bacterium]